MKPRGDDLYQRPDGSQEPLIRLAYQANTIKSKFSGGSFTQVLEGTLQDWVDSEYVTRVDRGFVYDAQKRQDDINKSQDSADDKFWAEQTAYQDSGQSAEGIVTRQNADLAEFGFTDEELANWQNDTAETDSPTTYAEPELNDDDEVEGFNNDQYGLAAPAEINSTEPVLTPVTPQPTTSTAANPNTMTQNTITKTGGDKTITETPLVEPTPISPAKTGGGYTQAESNLTAPEGATDVQPDPAGSYAQTFKYQGKQVVGNTQGALDAQVNAIKTGKEAIYEDVDEGVRYRIQYDPITGSEDVLGFYDNEKGKWVIY